MADLGILVAFSERTGGVSEEPYASLDLSGSVGDDASRVDENRTRFMSALGLGAFRDRLITAAQPHGPKVVMVDDRDAGRGARLSGGDAPIPDADGLATTTADLPLMMLFADCVPVILVDPRRGAIAVLHAGWRGALAGIPAVGVGSLVRAGSDPASIVAYVGAHIGACCFEVGEEIMSQFANTFVTVAQAVSSHLDLGAVVTESLTGAGVRPTNVCRIESCTVDANERFFSYRAEGGVTGRHGALACILRREHPER